MMRQFAAYDFEVSAPAWPPKALQGHNVFRHWRSAADLSPPKADVLVAGDVDPGFAAAPAALVACLDAWRTSKLKYHRRFHVSLVDLSSGTPTYVGLRDGDDVFIASTSKMGVMYAVVQLHQDMNLIAAQVKPADSKALYQAARDQWMQDLVDAGAAKSKHWINANLPKLEHCVKLTPSGTVQLTDALNDLLTNMIKVSDNDARRDIIALLRSHYIRSLLVQSGLADFHPIAESATTRAVATMLAQLSQLKLASPSHSLWMLGLMKQGADTIGTWASYALDGLDDLSPTPSITRTRKSIAGKVGYMTFKGHKNWWYRVYSMADASIVATDGGKLYGLAFAIPADKAKDKITPADVIRPHDILPLIRSVHDCI